MALLVLLIIATSAALVLVLVLRDGGSGGGGTAAPATTTTIPPPTTTTTGRLPTTPEGFAQALYAAWKAGDRTAAARVASADAVTQMFAVAYQPAATGADPYASQGCGAAAGSVYCTWKTSAGAQIQIQVRNLTGGLPILVTGVTRPS